MKTPLWAAISTKIHISKWTVLYILVSLFWMHYNLELGGGEEGLVPFLVTLVLTLPISTIFVGIGHLIPGDLLIPLMLVLNYIQWKFFIKIWKSMRNKNYRKRRL